MWITEDSWPEPTHSSKTIKVTLVTPPSDELNRPWIMPLIPLVIPPNGIRYDWSIELFVDSIRTYRTLFVTTARSFDEEIWEVDDIVVPRTLTEQYLIRQQIFEFEFRITFLYTARSLAGLATKITIYSSIPALFCFLGSNYLAVWSGSRQIEKSFRSLGLAEVSVLFSCLSSYLRAAYRVLLRTLSSSYLAEPVP